MAIKDVKRVSTMMMQDGYFSMSYYARRFKYSRELFLAVILLVVASLGFFSYRWYTGYREQSAQQALADSVELFKKASQAGTPDDWASVATQLQLAYDQHSHASIAPYFLAYKSQALVEQGKDDEARATMEVMVKGLSATSPLAPLFKIRYALMLLDAADETEQHRGLQALESLAYDVHNTQQDMALFYMGSYYASQDKTEQARQAWQDLVSKQENFPSSPWVQEAQEQLSFLKK